MLKHALRLSAACTAVATLISAGPAMAMPPDGFAATVGANYSRLSFSHSSADMWGGDASGAFGFGNSNLAAQGDIGYHSISQAGTDLNIWNAGGHFFWAPMGGRLGGSLQYESINCCGTNVHFTNYGGFGEAFLDNITVGGTIGGVSGDANTFFGSGSSTGWYGSGGVTGYIIPNLALTGQLSYEHLAGGGVTSYTAAAEWKFTDTLPLSVFGGYTYTSLPGGAGHVDQWTVGLMFYTDGNGANLMDKQRNGTLDRLVKPSLLYTF